MRLISYQQQKYETRTNKQTNVLNKEIEGNRKTLREKQNEQFDQITANWNEIFCMYSNRVCYLHSYVYSVEHIFYKTLYSYA